MGGPKSQIPFGTLRRGVPISPCCGSANTKKRGTSDTYISRTCITCGLAFLLPKTARISTKAVNLAKLQEVTHKTCAACRRHLPLDKFTKRGGRNAKGQYLARCKECIAGYEGHYKLCAKLADCGATLSDYDAALKSQEGLCAICRLPGIPRKPGGRRLRVDHSHKTGAFRGLLCGTCNTGLGNFHDDVVKLQAAIDYLRRQSET